MARNLLRALVAGLLFSTPAMADSTIHAFTTNTTSPIPANSCIEVDQGPGTDTKACPASVSAWAALFGFGPFTTLTFPATATLLGSNGSAFTSVTIPSASLLNGNGSTFGSVALGTNLTLSGTFPTQTLNAAGGAGFSTNNVIPKGNGTTLVSSGFTDNGTTISSTEQLSVGGVLASDMSGSGVRCVHVDNTGKQSVASADCGTGGGGLSGMTAGQIPVAATATTVTSSLPLSGTTGATQVASATSAAKVAGHAAAYDANGNLVDSGVVPSGGGGTAVLSYGQIAGGPSAYTIASPTPAVSSNVANYVVCASIPATVAANTGAATLAVGTAAAMPLRINTNSGALAFSGGEFPGNATGGGEIQTCFKADSAPTTWVMMVRPGGGTIVNPSARAITQNEWSNGQYYLCTAACSLTLPNLATTTLSAQAGPVVVTIGVLATLTAQGTDVVNNGQPGASTAGGTFIVPADMTTPLFTSGVAGATAYSVPVGPIQYFPITFYTNQVLNAPGSFGSVATPRTVVGIKCRVDTPSGVTGTIDVYSAPSGTALSAGTKLNTTSCNLNGTANTVQDMGITSANILNNYQVGFVVATGAPVTDGGTQLLQINYR